MSDIAQPQLHAGSTNKRESDMTEQQENTKQATSKLGLTAEGAAGAAIAQSLSIAAQSEVDALRNQNTVNMVAMGVAYAKWLQNPLMGEPFRELVKTAGLGTGSDKSGGAETFDRKTEPAASGKPEPSAPAGSNPLSAEVFSYFLSPRQQSE